MKKYIILGTLLSLNFWACNDAKQQNAEAQLDELEIWLKEVPRDTNDMNMLTWEEVSIEYASAIEKVENVKDDLSEESKKEYEELQKEFDDLQMQYKAAIDNTQTRADDKMKAIEVWMISKSENTENYSDEDVALIEAEWNEFKSDLIQNVDHWTDETVEKWNTLENRVEQWIEYDLAQNLEEI